MLCVVVLQNKSIGSIFFLPRTCLQSEKEINYNFIFWSPLANWRNCHKSCCEIPAEMTFFPPEMRQNQANKSSFFSPVFLGFLLFLVFSTLLVPDAEGWLMVSSFELRKIA